MYQSGSILCFEFALRTKYVSKIVLKYFWDHSMAHLFDRVLDNITDSYYFPSLTKSVNAIKGLFFCHWIPLWLKKMNTASDRKIQPILVKPIIYSLQT